MQRSTTHRRNIKFKLQGVWNCGIFVFRNHFGVLFFCRARVYNSLNSKKINSFLWHVVSIKTWYAMDMCNRFPKNVLFCSFLELYTIHHSLCTIIFNMCFNFFNFIHFQFTSMFRVFPGLKKRKFFETVECQWNTPNN